MSYINRVIKGTCPKCGQTKIFKSNGNPLIFKLPVMNNRCSKSNYSFHHQSRFYFSAMYVSYGWIVADMVAVIVLVLIFNQSFMQMFNGIVIFLFLLSTFNYKIARIMWFNMFFNEAD